ncbi:MAG: DUF2569 family protein [Acidobacteriia bacterium]|nr:DUF2569 family protein [Terriglobia bacterium]
MFARVWGSGFELESMFDLALTAFGVLAGAMVWHVHPRAFIFLWIYFGLTVGLLLLGIAGFFLGDEGQDNQMIIQLVRSLFSTIIWFLYFKQSDRVQATFGRNL